MTTYEIPLVTGPQSFVVDLGSAQYRMTVKWCPPAACWTLDLDQTDGTAVARGLPLVPGVDILGQLTHIGFDGELRVQSLDDPGKTPDYASLGTNGLLFFVMP